MRPCVGTGPRNTSHDCGSQRSHNDGRPDRRDADDDADDDSTRLDSTMGHCWIELSSPCPGCPLRRASAAKSGIVGSRLASPCPGCQ